jgi:GNAT superfamily N-acetyltransferase
MRPRRCGSKDFVPSGTGGSQKKVVQQSSERGSGSLSQRATIGLEPSLTESLVGLTYLSPDRYGKGWAWFNGIYVLPKFRGRQVGSVLLSAAIVELRRKGQKKLSVYTLAFLDHLAPGASMYLKSGAKLVAEHLELQRSP